MNSNSFTYERSGYYTDATQHCHHTQPDANVSNPFGHCTSIVCEELSGIETKFKNVVDKSKKWAEWKCYHKKCAKSGKN